MTISTCPEPLKLKQLLHGKLDEASSDSLAEHLRGCNDCQAKIQGFEQESFDLGIDQSALNQVALGFEQESECRWATALAMEVVNDSPSSETKGDFELPMELGDYRLLEPIAKGGMGVVYRAHHMRLGREVAVKIIAGARLSDKRTLQRFEAEMRALGRLSHPNIVAALDARELAGQPVLIMEFVNGLALNEIVRRLGPLPADCVAAIGRSVAAALEYASRNGLIHRDVKPSNIMINELGEVKLLDLGLARFQLSQQEADDRTTTGFALGTADYMSPEQIQDARNVDVRSDLYSLGCTLFKLLTGKVPYDDDRYVTNFAKLSAHVAQEPIVVPSKFKASSTELVKIIEQLTAKSISDRPASAQDVSLQLDKLASTADLARLVEIAKKTALQIDRESPSSDLPQSKPIVASNKRFVPPWLGWILAAGLLPFGIWLGTWLTIEKADGTKTRVELPNNSTASISDAGEVNVRVGTPSENNPSDSTTPITIGAMGTYSQPTSASYNKSSPTNVVPSNANAWNNSANPYYYYNTNPSNSTSVGSPYGRPYVGPGYPNTQGQLPPPPNGINFNNSSISPSLPVTNQQLAQIANPPTAAVPTTISPNTNLLIDPTKSETVDLRQAQNEKQKAIETVAAQAAQEEKKKDEKKKLPRNLSNVNDSTVAQADVSSAIDAAMNTADASTDPVYLGYPFQKWLNLFNKDRSSDIMLTSGKAILILADAPEQKSQAAKVLLERCRQYGGRVMDGGHSVSGSWMEFMYHEYPKFFPDPWLDAITNELKNGNKKSFEACDLILSATTEKLNWPENNTGKANASNQQTNNTNSRSTQVRDLLTAWSEARNRVGDSDHEETRRQSRNRLMRLAWNAKIAFDELPSNLQIFAKTEWEREKGFGLQVHGAHRGLQPNQPYPYGDFAEAWLPYWMTPDFVDPKPVIIVRKLFEEEFASQSMSSLMHAYHVEYKTLLSKLEQITIEDAAAIRKFLVERFADSHFDRDGSECQVWPSILRWLANISQIKSENADKALKLLRETEVKLVELTKLIQEPNRESSRSDDPFSAEPENSKVEELYLEMNKALAEFCNCLEIEPVAQEKTFRIRSGWVGTGYGQTMDEQGNIMHSHGSSGGGGMF